MFTNQAGVKHLARQLHHGALLGVATKGGRRTKGTVQITARDFDE